MSVCQFVRGQFISGRGRRELRGPRSRPVDAGGRRLRLAGRCPAARGLGFRRGWIAAADDALLFWRGPAQRAGRGLEGFVAQGARSLRFGLPWRWGRQFGGASAGGRLATRAMSSSGMSMGFGKIGLLARAGRVGRVELRRWNWYAECAGWGRGWGGRFSLMELAHGGWQGRARKGVLTCR